MEQTERRNIHYSRKKSRLYCIIHRTKYFDVQQRIKYIEREKNINAEGNGKSAEERKEETNER